MVEVRRSAIIDAPIEQVWSLLRDFNGHDSWHPAVATSRIEEGAPADMVGAVRDFRLADGSRIREQLLSLSDRDCSFTYCILDAPIPLMGYVANVRVQPVTDGGKTFWEWRSRFATPPGRERELVLLVGEQIYEAGFRAIRQHLTGAAKPRPQAARPARPPTPPPAAFAAATDEARAVVMIGHGGPDVLQLRKVPVTKPGPGEVRIRQHAIGVNYIDIYTRTGYFDLVTPPGIPGMEAAGEIESVGPGVTGWSVGDRVAYACPPPGSYVDLRVMGTELLVRPPDFLSDEQVAASLLKGITASFLLHDVYVLKPEDTILVHAAGGGVGLLLCQWASALGARVIGTASSSEKLSRALGAGCAEVINYRERDFVEEVMRFTGGSGVDAVFDAVGRDTFQGSVDCLRPRGSLVSFGQASGDIGAFEVGRLAAKSVTLSRPNYGHYTGTQAEVAGHAARFFDAVARGFVQVPPPRTFQLDEAAVAHVALESREIVGSLVLLS